MESSTFSAALFFRNNSALLNRKEVIIMLINILLALCFPFLFVIILALCTGVAVILIVLSENGWDIKWLNDHEGFGLVKFKGYIDKKFILPFHITIIIATEEDPSCLRDGDWCYTYTFIQIKDEIYGFYKDN